MTIEQIKDKLKSEEYDFLRTNKNLGNSIIVLTLGGSHAYGMDKEGSDSDVRGIALNSKSDILLGTDFEQVVDVDTDTTMYSFNKMIQLLTSSNPKIPFRVELFSLYKISGTDGYYKKIYQNDREYNIEFKCLDNYMMPFVLRYFLGQEVTKSDRVFSHEGLLSRFIETPKIEVKDE